jgi:Rhodopirellula transposase DDE domain
VNAAAATAPTLLRVSVDAKATVKVGPFSRHGRTRVAVAAADHDFAPLARVTPVGVLLPGSDELFLYLVTSRVTSDCLADVLTAWWTSVQERFPAVTTLLLNLDNGPENHSHRTQFMARLVAWGQATGLTIQLAYYPPYHSKYNPIERCWGALEQHWNGDLLDSIAAVVGFTQTMTWKGQSPTVTLVTTIYPTGVRLSKAAMAAVEQHLQRRTDLPKWFVTIPAPVGLAGHLIS